MRGEAAALARVLDTVFSEIRSGVKLVAERTDVAAFLQSDSAGGDREKGAKFSDVLKDLARTQTNVERYAIIAPDGKIAASSSPDSIGSDFSDRDYFKGAIQGRAIISQPVKSRVTGKATLLISNPVRSGDRVIGVLYAAISLDNMHKTLVEPVMVGKHGYAYVLEQNGLIVMHKNPEYLFNGGLEAGKVWKEMAASGTHGFREYTGVSGNTVFNAFAQSKIAGLTVVVQAESDDVFSSLSDIRRFAALAAIVSVLAGIACLYLVTMPILKKLSEASEFARRIADGDLTAKMAVRGKDEICLLAVELAKIPAKIGDMLERIHACASRVSEGNLRDRVDASAFPGAYADLARAVNVLGESYVHVVDNFPMPVMSCDTRHNILFLNPAAQKVVGGNHTGTPCHGHLRAPQCNTGDCLGKVCMEKEETILGDTQVTPLGKKMDIRVLAVPVKNESGIVGYCEFITDITQEMELKRATQSVVEKAFEISSRLSGASTELAAQVEQVSRGAEMQRERVESTASAMNEMNSTVLEVARNAGQASEQSENTRGKAESGEELVGKVVRSINNVNSVAATLQENMQELGSKAESIGGVMNVISDIADQTNLLALNAAIEAARAGEAGRGFAVVADEVRKLAEKTMSATQEVGGSITAIQQAARKNIEEVGTAAKSITEATELANSSGAALKEIVDLAAANSSVVASIATAAEEQSATSEEINRAIDEINRVVGETTQGMVQSSAAVQELSQMAQELRMIMEKLK
jgi:methyl-accepting chemotaxis protein